jgi:hypothetical protein
MERGIFLFYVYFLERQHAAYTLKFNINFLFFFLLGSTFISHKTMHIYVVITYKYTLLFFHFKSSTVEDSNPDLPVTQTDAMTTAPRHQCSKQIILGIDGIKFKRSILSTLCTYLRNIISNFKINSSGANPTTFAFTTMYIPTTPIDG